MTVGGSRIHGLALGTSSPDGAISDAPFHGVSEGAFAYIKSIFLADTKIATVQIFADMLYLYNNRVYNNGTAKGVRQRHEAVYVRETGERR